MNRVIDHVYEYMKHHGMLTADRGKDRATYIELNFFGSVDQPLDAVAVHLGWRVASPRQLSENLRRV